MLSILKSAYREFAERVGEVKAPRGAKRDQVLTGIDRLAARPGGFTISEREQTCPGVCRDMVRRVLREQQSAGAVECQGRGSGAAWAGKGGNYPQVRVIKRAIAGVPTKSILRRKNEKTG
ncbi:MAG: hypothetical protein ACYCY5_03890 [Sulfuricella sp.]